MSGFGWIEKFDQAGDRDIDSKIGFIREFLVEGYPPDQILNTPGDVIQLDPANPHVGEPLPLIGTTYGAGVGVLEQYAVVAVNKTANGNPVTEVQARYSNDRRWRGSQPIDPFIVGKKRPTFRRETVVTDIPYARLGSAKTVQVIGGVQTTDVRKIWTPKSKRFEHKVFSLVVTVTVEGWDEQLTHMQMQSIEEEAGNLHFVNGKWQHFTVGDAIPLEDEDKKYELEYTWTADPGTETLGPGPTVPHLFLPPMIWGLDPQTGLLNGRPPGVPDPDPMIRPPFHELLMFLQPDANGNPSAEELPGIDAVPLYRKVNKFGWANLPGLTSG